ncbi:MAG: ABC transporter substrate-binding protein, partial [Candidatus Tectomicrobia bacterium]|nr:ABC transporter substrate-binding protein [Candidatus Tectomicrobia bacterium]
MVYPKFRGPIEWLCMLVVVCFPLTLIAQQAKKSDADLVREGPLAFAAAHDEKPRRGGKFVGVLNEKIPFYDMHQTSLGGIFAATAPAYNGLVRTSPYDSLATEVIPELAHSWEFSADKKSITFHLHKGVKWHDGAPFSSADVKYTVERIMNPPKGMVSPRGPVFQAVIDRVEAPGPHTVVVHGKGPTTLLLDLFANGHNAIIPKHIVEKDPVNALKTQIIGTGPFRIKGSPTESLWEYERNPDYFIKGLPYTDELEIHIIDDAQAMLAALLSKRIHWSGAFLHPNLDGDLAKSAAQQNTNLIHGPMPGLIVTHLALQSEKPPFDDVRVRQAVSEAIKRDAISALGNQTGAVGTGNYALGRWKMSKEVQEQLIGYGPDMKTRIANAKKLLASYEEEKGKIDWRKIQIQCSSNIKFSCENAQVVQQLLKKIDVNIQLDPMLVAQHRANEVSGDFLMSLLGAAFDFDDP